MNPERFVGSNINSSSVDKKGFLHNQNGLDPLIRMAVGHCQKAG
jgi:hypothetical protein